METIGHFFDRFRARPEPEEERRAREAAQQALIEKLAQGIVARRLEAPATLFLELNRPLGFVFSQATYFARPLLGLVLPPQEIEAAAQLLDDPKAIDALLDRLHQLSTGAEA